MQPSAGVSLSGTSAWLIGAMVRSAQKMVQQKSNLETRRVRVIMRQTEGRQDNLSQHAEGQHVFVVRHRGGGPCCSLRKLIAPKVILKMKRR